MTLAYRYSDQTETWHNNEAKKRDPAIALGIFCNQHEKKKKSIRSIFSLPIDCRIASSCFACAVMNSAKTSPMLRK